MVGIYLHALSNGGDHLCVLLVRDLAGRKIYGRRGVVDEGIDDVWRRTFPISIY